MVFYYMRVLVFFTVFNRCSITSKGQSPISYLNHSTFFEKSQKLQNHWNRICLLRHFGNVGDWNLIHDLHVDGNNDFGEFLAFGCWCWQNYLWPIVFATVNDRTSRLDKWLGECLKSFSGLWNQCSRFIFRNLNDVIFLKDRRNWWDNCIARFTIVNWLKEKLENLLKLNVIWLTFVMLFYSDEIFSFLSQLLVDEWLRWLRVDDWQTVSGSERSQSQESNLSAECHRL